jgi:hypothetical protein
MLGVVFATGMETLLMKSGTRYLDESAGGIKRSWRKTGNNKIAIQWK